MAGTYNKRGLFGIIGISLYNTKLILNCTNIEPCLLIITSISTITTSITSDLYFGPARHSRSLAPGSPGLTLPTPPRSKNKWGRGRRDQDSRSWRDIKFFEI